MQKILVMQKSVNSFSGILSLLDGETPIMAGIPVVIGKNGMTNDKQEGDGMTPQGVYQIISFFGERGENRYQNMPFIEIESDHIWVDDDKSKFYNTLQKRNTSLESGDPDWNSFEEMAIPEYRLGWVVGYNTDHPRAGIGSAIFGHIWRSHDRGTAGCVAMSLDNLRKISALLDKKEMPEIHFIPASKS